MTFINVNVGSLSRRDIINLVSRMSELLREKEPKEPYLIVPCFDDGSGKISVVNGNDSVLLVNGSEIFSLTYEEIYNIIKERRNL